MHNAHGSFSWWVFLLTITTVYHYYHTASTQYTHVSNSNALAIINIWWNVLHVYFIVPDFFLFIQKNPKNYFFVFSLQSLVPLTGKRCEKEDEKITIKKKSQIIPVWFAGGFVKSVFCKEQTKPLNSLLLPVFCVSFRDTLVHRLKILLKGCRIWNKSM